MERGEDEEVVAPDAAELTFNLRLGKKVRHEEFLLRRLRLATGYVSRNRRLPLLLAARLGDQNGHAADAALFKKSVDARVEGVIVGEL